MVAILSDQRTVEYQGLDLWTRWLFLAIFDDPLMKYLHPTTFSTEDPVV